MSYIYENSERFLDNVDDWLCKVGTIFLYALMLVVVFDVVLRYVFKSPLIWSHEIISYYLMPGLFFLSVSHTLKSDSHISVDILLNYVSEKTRYFLAFISYMLAVPPLMITAFYMIYQTYRQYINDEYFSSGLALPVWTTTILAALGFSMLAVRVLLKAIGFAGSIWTSKPLTKLPLISGTEEHFE